MSRITGCVIGLYAVLTALLVADSACAADGVPALLQFAKQYQQQNIEQPAGERERTSTGKETVSGKSKGPGRQQPPKSTILPKTFTLHQDLIVREQQLARQRIELEALRQEIITLRSKTASESPPVATGTTLPDLKPLQQWISALADVWRGTPDAQRTAFLLHHAAQQTAQAQTAATLANDQLTALKEAVQKTEYTGEQRLKKSQDTSLALRETLQDSELKLSRQQAMTNQIQSELATLRKKTSWSMAREQMTDENMRLSYAAGSALGRDIQQMMVERQSWGVPVERDGLLAGVIDSVSGRLLLPQTELTQLLEKADAIAVAARDNILKIQTQRDKGYLEKFIKQEGVKQSPMGFWYQIDYIGEGEFTEDTVIDVAVKEMLTDGTVIQDMDLSGKVLSQPLSSFPPLFREAVSHLHNHGSLTMVVPSALAYGETGYPPKVPANATMVYTLRIDNSQK